MRQKTQLDLAFPPTAKGEARSPGAVGTEARAARVATESLAAGGPSMEAIVERDNLRKALAQVRRNKGAPGIDGMTVDDLAAHLKDHWPTIKAQLLEGAYQPLPVRRVEIPKASGGMRPLGIPTVLDRFIQQAALQVLGGLGPDLLRAQPRLPPWPLGARGGARGASLHCRRRPLCRGYRPGGVSRPGEPRHSDGGSPLGRSLDGASRRRRSPGSRAGFGELTRRTRGASLARIVEELSRYLVGWRGYFGICETPSVLRSLDQWVRRRLRAIAWKQWKRGRTRFAELRRRGVGKDLAAQTAGSPHGPWRLSNSPALTIAIPDASLETLGLATVASQQAAQPSEPPCTDPYARWRGRGGAARLPPIPIGAAYHAGKSPAATKSPRKGSSLPGAMCDAVRLSAFSRRRRPS